MTASLPEQRHTLSAFDDELDEIRGLVNEMASLALGALRRAMAALAGPDADLAERVVAGDASIDALEARLEKLVVRTIALRAPMADDLRTLIVVIRIGSLLERVGDHAKNIARRAAGGTGRGFAAPLELIGRMGALAGSMIADTIAAFNAGDPDAAAAAAARDLEMDELFDRLTEALLSAMTARPREVEAGTQLLFVGKQLERIGDYATSIAESAFYMATGGQLPDRREAAAA